MHQANKYHKKARKAETYVIYNINREQLTRHFLVIETPFWLIVPPPPPLRKVKVHAQTLATALQLQFIKPSLHLLGAFLTVHIKPIKFQGVLALKIQCSSEGVPKSVSITK